MNRRRIVTLLGGASLVLAAAASIYLAFWPTYSGVSVSNGAPPQTNSATLIAVNGYWVVALLLLPPVLCAVGILAARSKGRSRARAFFRWSPVGLLLLFCLVGSLSIGLAYLPAALALVATVAVASIRPGKVP